MGRPGKKRERGSPIILPDQDFIKRESYHRALACRTRLKILAMLEQKPMFGFEVVRHLGIGQSTVSYHLGILRRAGLIETQPRAEGILYSIATKKKMA